MQQHEISTLMLDASNDAIRFAKEHQVELDKSLTSLLLVDQLLAELHSHEQAAPHSAEIMFTLCNIFGAYIGQVFIAHVGGQWQYNQTDKKAPFVFVQFNDKEFPFASVCYHKITQDNTISLANYMKQAMANAMQ
ncbi:hypothetical protein ORJ04_00060 [Rheinheimera baltica]|uniref:DUF3806 domain-containing protein n=1 Tax=Rheinheimera baltica TaxID=67576 RepID=A0ABT9HTK7_9GAMM|nr:hypothetical protein [Rheinheimera baltica]MDP5134343.1 hypothetical protein [Rheinheimera baltica]